jgi:site-specific recombinase XerD
LSCNCCKRGYFHGKKSRLFGGNQSRTFVETFLKEQLSAHTRRAYEKDLIAFLEYLKQTGAAMTVHTLVRYRALLEQRVSPRTGRPLTRISTRDSMRHQSFNRTVVSGDI